MTLMRCRRPLILISVAVVAGLSLLAAGCGGGDSPRVASVASSTAATTRGGAVAFARCMRSHGVSNFPDPSDGVFDGLKLKRLQIAGPLLRAAQSKCEYLIPTGMPMAGSTITRADQGDYLRAAACVRRHGVPGFPDPTFRNNGVTLTVPSTIDRNSPVVKRAVATCRKLIPAGLPYSGSG